MVRPFYLILIILLSFYACTPSPENQSSSQATLPFEAIALSGTTAFKDADENWQIAGDVYVPRDGQGEVELYKGEGVLVNLPTDEHNGNLFTTLEHGDIEVELDFMMPKGSNSGIYLQGRYEVQLFDSWGIAEPKHSDCGGIYQRWDEGRPEGEKGYQGHAPRINAAKAPGLWQHLTIRFKAPDFDENGKKISNAKFVEVTMNGVMLHQNVEVTGPTRAAGFEDEQPLGPLMIQGDHGPVAFRNIRYKRYGDQQITLENMQYQLFEGVISSPDTMASLTPKKEGKTDSLSYLINREYEKYALRFTGTMKVPATGNYLFKAKSTGGHLLKIDGKTVIDYIDDTYDAKVNTIKVEEGEHPFEFVYIKTSRPWQKGLGLFYEGPEIPMQPLHTQASMPQPEAPEPIIVLTTDAPELQRGFLIHKGKKRTHAVGVGTPQKINYTYDLSQGALLEAWGGGFIDATDMWHERGEAQLMQSLGSTFAFSNHPAFAVLANDQAAWPDSVDIPQYYKGYALDSMGLPAFRYILDNTTITDYLYPDTNGTRALHREIRVQGDAGHFYCRLAGGKEITQLPDGSFAVDDKNYYLVTDQPEKAIQRSINGNKELLWPVNASEGETTVKYTLIW